MATVLFESSARATRLDADLDVLDAVDARCIAGLVDVPCGLHRVSALTHGVWQHRWFEVGDDDATVRFGEIRPATLDVTAEPGAGQLVRFPRRSRSLWLMLTAHIAGVRPLPPLRNRDLSMVAPGDPRPSPLADMIRDVGGAERVLDVLERSFVDGFLTPDEGDLVSIGCWRHTLGILASARPEDLHDSRRLLLATVDVLQRQLKLIGADLLDDALAYELDFLAVELCRSVDPTLAMAGRTLRHLA